MELQEKCFNNIKTLCSNYKKDSKERKTESYLRLRLESLEAQWKDFQERHQLIVETTEDKSSKYFTEDVFTRTSQLYQDTKTNIEILLNELRDRKPRFDLSGMLGDNVNESVKSLLEKQECNFKALDRVMSKIDLNTVTEKWELQDYLTILKSKWDVIDKQHWELEAILKGSDIAYYNIFVAIEGRYDELRRNLNNKLWSTAHYEKSAPTIEVPEFNGNYTQWISFKDLFMEAIHNNPTINKAQKMQHLKTKLRGEAERLVQHLGISADNYSSCWEILAHRYDNRRLQFTSYINTMLGLPVIQHPDHHNLKKMHDVITECLNGLANIGIETATWDPLIIHLMSQKLDTSSYTDYMKELHDHRELPQLTEFLYFLESKFMAYETMKNAKKEVTNLQKHTILKSPNRGYLTRKHNYFEQNKASSKTYFTTYGQCPYCDGSHVLMKCPKFISMDTAQRNNTVAKLNLCANCLYSHENNKCNSTKTCKECNMHHHTLLHNSSKKNLPISSKNNSNYNSRPTTSTQLSSNHLSTDDMEILLTTVQLQVRSANGSYVTLRALLDQGSQVNLITESAAQLLNLRRKRLNATITGVGSVSGDCKGHLQLTCKSINSDYKFDTEALIMKKLINNLPNSSFNNTNWPHLENLKLADPEFNVSRPVDLLLGADVYSNVIMDGVLKGPQQAPIAQQTHLGWILCGKLKTFNCNVTLIDLCELTKFWEHEDIAADNNDIPKDDYCEEHYSETVQRAPDGKYIVTMPFSTDYEQKLGKSKHVAISQFLQLEKRFERQTKLALMYRDFIREYIDLGHMKPLTPNATEMPECYLPHHGVLREKSSTTKLRTVFNGSQKTSSGLSLNHLQEKGPNLQKDIQALILKWRSYRYAYTADIEKMYRCIWITEEQQRLQRIIWRDSSTQPLQEFQLCTVTYGMKCAPWLAMRTLIQLARDDGHKYPDAAHTLQNEFFVDDLVSGHNSIEGAILLQQALLSLLQGGGMNLRKWSANHSALLANLSEEQLSPSTLFDFKHEDSTKTLGLGWNTTNDTFTFNWNFEESKSNTNLTKRRLLSAISKLYDPLGWLSPITITAKLLFQKVWMSKLGWDETLPAEIQNEWLKLKTELPMVKGFEINRWLGGAQDNMELLGFCDASEKAYSCVIYSRVPNSNGPPTITLLVAKTRVAPLAQKTTLPRLELSGALLLAQLVNKVIEAYKGHNITIQAWCDSQVVLAWLQGDVSRWERYVGNRVTKIKNIIPSQNWHYVKSTLNPADCASRGLYPTKLLNFNLWWKGPDFLRTLEKEEVPKTSACLLVTKVELKKTEVTTLPTNVDINFIKTLLINKSSLSQIVRIMAWILRFAANARDNKKSETNFLTTNELANANEKIIKFIQQTEFEQEYKNLMKNNMVSNKSSIYKLNPYLDEKGVMRVGGRLNNSSLPSGMKNPILLSRDGRFTQLLIEQAHSVTLHGGARLTLAYIRQRYWIVGGNRVVKTKLRHCVRCHRHKPTEHYQIMSDLPQQRTTPSRPFTHTGVDFTGHVEVKLNKGRGVKTSKGYIAIFVCMATKAVHIELVSDLSTETFLAAFQRMCSRRGTPKHVYSDRGTNFIGASKVLHREFKEFKKLLSPEFFNEISKMEVEWHFNAPAWPTAGGLWEAAVKSLKYHLRRVLGEQKLTYEEFSTLLVQIEACMNSRPLCPLTEDPEEFYNYLTPGHFLVGGPVMSLPLSDHSDCRNIDLRRRWQLTENMLQQFWKSWSNEYLAQLQTRSKWNKPTKNIQKEDIVLVKDNNLPPGRWAMGRVLEVYPGADGYVRVVTVKTQTGITKRPVTKLSPLPFETKTTPEKQNNTTQNKLINRQKFSKTRKKKSFTFFTTLITLFTLITGSYGNDGVSSSAHITSLEPERPIYYDTIGKLQIIHNEWTLLLYYNLSNYWDGVQRLQSYLQGLHELCNKTDPRYCKITLEQLTHEMDILHHYNSILLSPHKHLSKRRKRGLVNGIGSIANSLFGILDQQFAEKYQKDIEAIQVNENYLLELTKNQTSVVELENSVLTKTENNIRQQLNMIDGFMNQTNSNLAKIESTMEAMMATSYFSSASLATYLLLKNMRAIQELLFDSITDVYKGHMDVHLLSPVDLIKQLNLISGRLPKTLTLPVENIRNDIKDVYKLLYVKARVTTNYFMFEVHIPLTSDEDFLLYRAIPLPVKTDIGFSTIQLQSSFIAVNFEKNTYISVTEDEIKHCHQLKPDRLICNKNIPVYNLHNNKVPCEAKLLSHRSSTPCDVKTTDCDDAWIALHSPNSWLAVCCGTCTMRTICESDISAHSITSSGIVTLAQGCILQSKEFTIHSHNEYNTNINIDNKMYIPTLTSTVNKIVKIPLTYRNATKIQLDTVDTQEIDSRILFIKEHEALPSSISCHDVHQYAICYGLLGVAIIGTIVWLIKKRVTHRYTKKTNAEHQYEDIELQVIPPVHPTAGPSSVAPQQRPRQPTKKATDNLAFNFGE